ncbi:alpha/beta fold hydrolase [Martelella lutilitoris]|uniref:Alpha/beta fold hydrolase n=1 Tax=Martelella lutilitoris TaxID=2583532 RepID=A0A5C4JQF7_9HYPH|nr:alpha/beta fold hydrolase [Martelella lutilitoris]TNB46899.1 alpha/beta fold hydrolase [Martelella lutilitoris]
MRLARIALLALVPVIVSPPVLAQEAAPFDPIGFELELAAVEALAERLAMVDAAIAALEASPDPDPEIYFDLSALRLDILREAGETAAAAAAAEGLADFAIRMSGQLDRNPLPYLDLAATFYTETEAYREALRVLDTEIAYRRNGGQSGQVLADLLNRKAEIARLRGDMAAAEEFAGQANFAIMSMRMSRRSGQDGGFSAIDVFYATDRARTGDTDPAEFYGYGRGDLEYGVVTVTIPDTHVPGAIETPSIWKLEFGPSPAKHVMVQKVDPMEANAYFAKMNDELAERERKEIVVFIHGFNTRFDAAAKRAAQLAYDMDYRGVPVLYSWPSAGQTVRYVADTAVVRLSGRRLSMFLEDLRARSGADTIHIVAHSMGNRALTDALELMALRDGIEEGDDPVFGQVFFAAPDVDAGLFKEMMKTIHPLAERLTLYTSENDWALVASRKLHGNAPRAGQGGDSVTTDELFDTIDMSDLGEDMLAHTYFADDSSALADIVSLIWRNPPPNVRCGMTETETATGETAWKYQKGGCFDKTMIGLISHLWSKNDISREDISALISELVTDQAAASEIEGRLDTYIAPEGQAAN